MAKLHLRNLLTAASCLILGMTSVAAQDEGPSVTLMKHVTKAQDALKNGDLANAREEFRRCIGLSPNTLEFYIGLYNCVSQSKEYDQIAFALGKMFQLDPTLKGEYAGEYGEALYYLAKYDEAIPWLKQGLRQLDSPQKKRTLAYKPPEKIDVGPVPTAPTKVPETTASGTTTSTSGGDNLTIVPQGIDGKPITPAGTTTTSTPAPPPREVISPEQIHGFAQSFDNAIRSEAIVIAEYQGFEKSTDIAYFHPPKAEYHITKILKGPPLNRHLPLRYEFHDRSENLNVPDGWKFGPDKMPAKGSQWILFIEHAVPRMGQFDTYQGAFGRQEANDKNLNKVYALLEAHSNR